MNGAGWVLPTLGILPRILEFIADDTQGVVYLKEETKKEFKVPQLTTWDERGKACLWNVMYGGVRRLVLSDEDRQGACVSSQVACSG